MKPLDQPMLRQQQVVELQEERHRIQSAIESPEYKKTVDIGAAKKSLNRIDGMLRDQAPEKLTGPERDKLKKEELTLREQWTSNMPPQEVMRKNPPGAVDWHTRWEKYNKPAIARWKNVRRQLEHDSPDPDLANIERYRPAGEAGAFRTDAQITGHMNYSRVPDKNWREVFGKTDPQPDAPVADSVVAVVKTRKPMSEANKQAARDRLAAARAKKTTNVARQAEAPVILIDNEGHFKIAAEATVGEGD